jgi:hypothetical protein
LFPPIGAWNGDLDGKKKDMYKKTKINGGFHAKTNVYIN